MRYDYIIDHKIYPWFDADKYPIYQKCLDAHEVCKVEGHDYEKFERWGDRTDTGYFCRKCNYMTREIAPGTACHHLHQVPVKKSP